MPPQKTLLIHIGDYLFRRRNLLFPLLLAVLFFSFRPEYTLFGQEWLEDSKDILALLIGLSGLAVRGAVIGYAYIKRGGLNKQVYADTLVTEGLFTLCRNPLYFGNMLIYFAVFLVHGNVWVVAIGTAAFYGIYTSIIAAEEYFLHRKFGLAYKTYCKETPRWIPRISRFSAATQGMHFNLKKALLKDYSTIGMTLLALAMPETLELLQSYPMNRIHTEISVLVALMTACIAGMLLVRYLKKSKKIIVS